MLSIVLFLIIVSSLAVLAAFRWNKSFEEVLPVSAMGIILILFLFGMCNLLKVGAIVVSVAAAGIYVYTIYWIIKNRKELDIKKTVFNLVTPGSIVFTILAVLIAYWNKGRLAMISDEFSHWLDTVVIMTRIDDFGTAPNSTAVFPSYPPAMSLFQYLLEKLTLLCGGEFSEWKAYYAYQIMAVAVMLPFTKVIGEATEVSKAKHVVKKLAGILLWFPALVAPLFFFNQVYNSLYIDPFLGVMGGCGFAMVALAKKKDWLYVTYITMLTAVLTLSKDVGIYLSLFIALYFLIDYLSREKQFKSIKFWLIAVAPFVSMFAAKMLWKLELTLSQTVQKFSAPFDIKGVIATLKGQGSEYYESVYNNFNKALNNTLVFYERIGLNYVAIMVLLTVLFILIQVDLFKKNRATKASVIAGAVIPSVAIIFYILSMFPLYVSRFVPEEALNLASFDRYCGIMFLTGFLMLTFLVRDLLLENLKPVTLAVVSILIAVSVWHSQKEAVRVYTERVSVQQSNDYREAINILAQKINGLTEEDSRILLVGYDEDQPFHPILDTISKPRNFTYSGIYFGDEVGDDSEDESLEELKETLKSEYDYVAIYRPTEKLLDNYSDLFENPEQAQILTLFKVSETGTLQFIQ